MAIIVLLIVDYYTLMCYNLLCDHPDATSCYIYMCHYKATILALFYNSMAIMMPLLGY
jgi:hypothetical protein